MTVDLDHLESAAKAATPGPWEDLSEHPDHLRGTINKGAKHIAGCSWFETPIEEQCVTVKEALANATYIAAANPQTVLELVAELRKARAERDWLAETLENHGLLLTVFGTDIPRCSEAEWLRRAREAVEREIDHD